MIAMFISTALEILCDQDKQTMSMTRDTGQYSPDLSFNSMIPHSVCAVIMKGKLCKTC